MRGQAWQGGLVLLSGDIQGLAGANPLVLDSPVGVAMGFGWGNTQLPPVAPPADLKLWLAEASLFLMGTRRVQLCALPLPKAGRCGARVPAPEHPAPPVSL